MSKRETKLGDFRVESLHNGQINVWVASHCAMAGLTLKAVQDLIEALETERDRPPPPKKRILHKEVDRCAVCPFNEYRGVASRRKCLKVGNVIKDDKTIPDWCPLPLAAESGD